MNRIVTLTSILSYNPNLFDFLEIPKGLDKETLIALLVLECNELELIYSDPLFLQHAIKYWTISKQYTWNKLFQSTQFDYNPIHNYDRNEEYTDITSGISSDNSSSSVKAFNDYSPTERESVSSNSEAKSSLTHKALMQGNIGVTTTQEMIEAEREVVKFDMYKHIVDDFKKQFCYMIY